MVSRHQNRRTAPIFVIRHGLEEDDDQDGADDEDDEDEEQD
jgi:hypothetical protein